MVSRRLHALNAAGFSMAEMLVVVAVIGVMAVLGYPYLLSYLQAAKLRAGAQELTSVINGARQLAIARNTLVCVTIVGNQAAYRTNVSAACGGGALFVGATTQSDGTIPLSNDVEITGTTANVVFTSLGAASTAGTYTVLNPTNGESLSVVVAASGRVRIQ